MSTPLRRSLTPACRELCTNPGQAKALVPAEPGRVACFDDEGTPKAHRCPACIAPNDGSGCPTCDPAGLIVSVTWVYERSAMVRVTPAELAAMRKPGNGKARQDALGRVMNQAHLQAKHDEYEHTMTTVMGPDDEELADW